MTRVLACIALLATFVASGAASAQTAAKPSVKFGIDALRDENFKSLAGKRVGLIASPASVDEHLAPTSTLFKNAEGVTLVAMFGPEHGIYGDEYAGDKVEDRTDPRTGIPIYSLYGRTRKPTPEMLAKLDTLVFDLQDIGSRSYTNISTMKVAMEACAEQDKEFVVLDRANPLGGERVEGPRLDEKKYSSFVGIIDVPYVHGMTTGELAQLMRDHFLPDYKKLRVVKMTGWNRDMVWEDTGHAWIPTSPHVPHVSSVAAYAATGIVGELYVISNGVGYTQPFEVVGAPYVNGEALSDALNEHWLNPRNAYEAISEKRVEPAQKSPKPEGVYFRSARFKPFYAKFKTELCQGVQVHVDA
ncbi:MAG: DUF1343 domain-containing protein, partial [Planctomycetota bacterium]|nr:DUF1343 domain-containing protein [Planctomycetota bacterium]